MKKLLLTAIILTGCASDGTLTPAGAKGVNTAIAILGIAIDTAAQVEAAKTSGQQLNSTQLATLAKNDLSGIAAIAQGSVGQTPATANVAQGAAIPSVGAAVQQALPATPITQGTVNLLYAAASK